RQSHKLYRPHRTQRCAGDHPSSSSGGSSIVTKKKLISTVATASSAGSPDVSVRVSAARMEKARRVLMLFAEDKSELTLRTYQKDLAHFAEWLGAADVAQAVGAFLQLERPDAHALVLMYKGYLRKAPVYRSKSKRADAREARS